MIRRVLVLPVPLHSDQIKAEWPVTPAILAQICCFKAAKIAITL
jgi:hypothetical protein